MINNNWELELNEYLRQGEPDQIDRSNAWKTAIGLQDVDGLKPSKYLADPSIWRRKYEIHSSICY